jgi:hypothetical protein
VRCENFPNESGVGAIGLHLLRLFLAALVLQGLFPLGLLQQNNYMRDSGVEGCEASTSAGGTSEETALTIAEAAWSGKPDDECRTFKLASVGHGRGLQRRLQR